MERRKFLALSAAAITGCSSQNGEEDREDTSSTTTDSSDNRDTAVSEPTRAEYQADKLKEVLGGDQELFEQQALFVGNPNSFDYDMSSIYLRDKERNSSIAERLGEGDSPREIWEGFLEENGYTESFLDSRFKDPLDYNVIAESRAGLKVLDSTDTDYVEAALIQAEKELEDVLGIDIEADIEASSRMTQKELEQRAQLNPDSMVIHLYSENSSELGTSTINGNFGFMNINTIGARESPEKALAKTFQHEAYHTLVNHPHIPGSNNLMSVSDDTPSDAEISDQAIDMATIYVNGEVFYHGGVEDGKGYVEVGFQPVRSINRGEEYLKQNTEAVLQNYSFPVEEWEIKAQDNTAVLSRDDAVVQLHPGEKAGYQEINVLRR